MGEDNFLIKNWEKLTSLGFGIVFLLLLLAIAFFLPNPTPTQWFVFRVLLALAAAGIAAIIPGLIAVNVSNIVRASGAIAVFFVVYLLNPPKLAVSEVLGVSINQTTGGKNSPAVVTHGDFTFTPSTTDEEGEKRK